MSGPEIMPDTKTGGLGIIIDRALEVLRDNQLTQKIWQKNITVKQL